MIEQPIEAAGSAEAREELRELVLCFANAWVEYRYAYEHMGGDHIQTGLRWKRLSQLERRALEALKDA